MKDLLLSQLDKNLKCKTNLYAGFESHSHLQAGLASLAGTPDAVTSFLKQAHAASRHQVYAPVCAPSPDPLHTPKTQPPFMWAHVGSIQREAWVHA